MTEALNFSAAEGEQEPVLTSFNIITGRLVIGKAAHEEYIESGGNPADIVELKQLLTDNEPNNAGQYKKLNVRQWTSNEYISYGSWLHRLVTDKESRTTRLSRPLINRAFRLGIGPSAYVIATPSRFGSFERFYEEISVEPSHRTHRYSEWTKQDFANYVDRTFAEFTASCKKKVKPHTFSEELRQRARIGLGPSLRVMYRRGYQIRHLLELSGYVNTREWIEGDFIEWGVKFMLANDGIIPTTSHLLMLSPVRKSPGVQIIYTKFGSMPAFQAEVKEAYEDKVEYQEWLQNQKAEEAIHQINNGTLPSKLLQLCATEANLIAAAAKYRVIQRLVPELEEKYKIQKAIIQRPGWFIKAIQRANPAITAGIIEDTAVRLGVFDDIWPMDDYLSNLRIAA